MNELWYLEDVNLYEILCPPKLKHFEKEHYKWYKKGDFVYFQNELAEKIFLVSKGKVKIVHYNEEGEEVVRAILSKGEIFGEMALLGEKKREEVAIAYSKETALCPMDVRQMQNLMRDNQRFSLRIFKIIGLRIKKLERRLDQLFFKDAKSRLKEFIRELYEEHGQEQDGQLVVEHDYTHKDIADLIGARRETVTILLKEFKSNGSIDYKRRRLYILKTAFFDL